MLQTLIPQIQPTQWQKHQQRLSAKVTVPLKHVTVLLTDNWVRSASNIKQMSTKFLIKLQHTSCNTTSVANLKLNKPDQ